jgi:hypothetical protein
MVGHSNLNSNASPFIPPTAPVVMIGKMNAMPADAPPPGWPFVLLAISFFVTQYWLSAVMDAPLQHTSLQQLLLHLEQQGFFNPPAQLDMHSVFDPIGSSGWPLIDFPPAEDSLLFGLALMQWFLLDGSAVGMGISLLTAVCGPLIEVALINGFSLYAYSHPAWMGVPTWIAWVYFAGGPAVGLLGRQVWHTLKEQHQHQHLE